MRSWWFLGLAAIAGVLMAIQGSLNSALSKVIGALEGSLLLHATGLVLSSLLLIFVRQGLGGLTNLSEAPWHLYLGGALNVGIIFAVMLSIAKTGAGPATTAIIVGQLSMALIVDLLGLFGLEKSPFTWQKGTGLALMAAAAWLLTHKN